MTTKVVTIREVIEPHIPISVVGPSDVGRMVQVNALVTALEAREEQIRKEAAASARLAEANWWAGAMPVGMVGELGRERIAELKSVVAKLREEREEK